MTGSLFMPVWTDAYLGDTRHLTTVQHGAYLLLLMAMWRNGGTLPLDEKRIARITGLPLDKWRKVSPEIMEFMTIEGSSFFQKRLRLELEKSLSVSAKRKVAGKSGGEAKSLKNREMEMAIARDLEEVGYGKNVASNTNTNTISRKGDGQVVIPPSNTSCLTPPPAGPSAGDPDRQPIGMDDLPGLDSFDQAGYGDRVEPAGHFEVDTPPPQPKRREPKRQTKIDPDLALGPREREYWTKLGLPEGRLAFEWSQFKNYHLSRGEARADWLASWRTWCGKLFERMPQAAAVFGTAQVDRFNKPLSSVGTRSAV